MTANSMPKRGLVQARNLSQQLEELRLEFGEARRALLEAEEELAEEQAAVNSFRMHCRLRLDRWVDRLQELQVERQSLLTQWRLMRNDMAAQDTKDGFWKEKGTLDPDVDLDETGNEELLLPTDTPRDKAAEKRLYRELARRFHPDLGVTAVDIAYRTEMMTAVNQAYQQQNAQALYDLASELDPSEAAELNAIENREVRQMHLAIVKCKKRRRRARQRLAALRQENTARLWRKARRLDDDGTHWWEVVRREIARAIESLEDENAELRFQLESLGPVPRTGEV